MFRKEALPTLCRVILCSLIRISGWIVVLYKTVLYNRSSVSEPILFLQVAYLSRNSIRRYLTIQKIGIKSIFCKGWSSLRYWYDQPLHFIQSKKNRKIALVHSFLISILRPRKFDLSSMEHKSSASMTQTITV